MYNEALFSDLQLFQPAIQKLEYILLEQILLMVFFGVFFIPYL